MIADRVTRRGASAIFRHGQRQLSLDGTGHKLGHHAGNPLTANRSAVESKPREARVHHFEKESQR